MIESLDLQSEKYVINRFIPMTALFKRLRINYRTNGNMFCPFHDNRRTMAAHLYVEEDGSELLWCFSEHKMFGSWDVYKRFIPDINTNELAILILNKMSPDTAEFILNNVGYEKELKELPFKSYLNSFRKGEISYKELLKDIVKVI